MIGLVVLLLALVVSACDETGPPLRAQNQCFENASCGGRRAYCDPVLLRCVRDTTEEPYPLFVRVSVAPEMLADAGVTLVPEVVHDLRTLMGRRDAEVLAVPRAVAVTGAVAELDGGQVANLLQSQVTLFTSDAEVPVAARVVETRPEPMKTDGGAPANLSVQLDPKRHYDVRVQPLASASELLPPYTRTDVGADQALKLDAPSVEGQAGRFLYRDQEQRADFVRLEERGTGAVLSSTARVQQSVGTSPSGEERSEGLFTLYWEPDVLRSKSFDLVISVSGYAPWQVTIRVDGERFLAGGDLSLPPVPKPVTVEIVVEDQRRVRLAGSEVVFVSSYPAEPEPPLEPPQPLADGGGPSAPPSLLGSDWCRWQDPARIACRGRFQTFSDHLGESLIELIPGRYDVFIIPPGAARARDMIVTRHDDEDNPGKPLLVGESEGEVRLFMQANVATPYTGTVFASKNPVAGVTLRALRRPTPSASSWGSIADFNRTFAVTSDRKGHFRIAPDVGYYDFVFEPELGSGFPWKLWLDCPNGPGAGAALAAVDLTPPVMVFGSVEFEETGTKLAGARIEAFTIVEAKNRPPRSVMIGRAVSDEKGDYMLALPTVVGEGDRCEGKASPVTDNGRSRR